MDAVEILENTDKIFPCFQPVFSADGHQVIGYGVLGRIQSGSQAHSLDSFLNDPDIPDEYRIEVENIILERALTKLGAASDSALLFINRDPDLLMQDHGEGYLEILKQHLPDKLDMIMLEISEANYKGELDPLYYMLTYFRTYGMGVAIGNLGEKSHMERIAKLSPQILKMNLKTMRNSGGQNDLMYPVKMLARKMGAALLFEGIENNYDMHYAWKNGGRYYQGTYLHAPIGHFVDRNILRDKFKEEFHEFILLEKSKLEKVYEITVNFQTRLAELLAKFKRRQAGTELLQALAMELETMCFRLYICDEEGFQKSPNLFRSNGSWIIQEEYRSKNWSWRPYFLENIIKMIHEKKGFLSDVYSDIETGDTIRTFSYPLSGKDFLFLDLSYSFLYEHDVLL
ncbi:EAL-associated domain-containing protein [Peribacillus sp. SCS-37]|uniref:EAL-associated domain-containing protein n=1 Tax=Paraperibacillus esterisolvens TaxID=3115296 RepID=UPI00390683A6